MAMIELERDLEPLLPAWDDLATETEASPFLRPASFRAWWEAFGAGGLRILTCREDGRLRGVLPIVMSRGVISSPTNPHSDLYGAVATPAARDELYRGLFELGARRINFSFLEAGGPDLASLEAAQGRYRLAVNEVSQPPYVDFDGTWDEYFASRSANLRRDVRRKRKRLAAAGQVEFEVVPGGPRLEERLAEGFAVEASGWKGAEQTAISSRPETLRFYRETAAWAERAGLLRLGFLRLDGRPIAFILGLETADAQFLLKLGIDPEVGRFSPGLLMFAAMIEHGLDAGLRTEFLGAGESYKLRWATGARHMVRLRAFAPTPAGRASRLIQVHGRRLAKTALRRG